LGGYTLLLSGGIACSKMLAETLLATVQTPIDKL